MYRCVLISYWSNGKAERLEGRGFTRARVSCVLVYSCKLETKVWGLADSM